MMAMAMTRVPQESPARTEETESVLAKVKTHAGRTVAKLRVNKESKGWISLEESRKHVQTNICMIDSIFLISFTDPTLLCPINDPIINRT